MVKSRLYLHHCLLCNGEVITKGSNCVIHETVCTTIKLAHCKIAACGSRRILKESIVIETSMVKHHYHVFNVPGRFFLETNEQMTV